MQKLLDANAIIRFLINDIPEQAYLTAQEIYKGAFTKEVVIAEVVYILEVVYKLSRTTISTKILQILELVEIENFAVINNSFKLFAETKLDFVDCLLISYNNIDGIEIFSFDKKLNNKLI